MDLKLDRHVRSIKKVLTHISHFLRNYDVINVGFLRYFVIFAGFGHGKCLKLCMTSSFFPKICILIGCINLQCLVCNRLHDDELLRYNRRKSGICSIRPFQNDVF